MYTITLTDLIALGYFIQRALKITKKKDYVSLIKEYEHLKWLFSRVFSKQTTYGVSKNTLSSNDFLSLLEGEASIEDSLYTNLVARTLNDLASRESTGHKALVDLAYLFSCVKLKESEEDYKSFVLGISALFDKSLECGVGKTLIFQTLELDTGFAVALANPVPDNIFSLEEDFYVSRKLDGVRCICVINNESISFYSRQGKEFYTLGVLEYFIREKVGTSTQLVLDGEVVIKGDDNNFKLVVGEIKKKNHTIENPQFVVFDAISLEGFYKGKEEESFHQRLDRLRVNHITQDITQTVYKLEQTMIEFSDVSMSSIHWNNLVNESTNNNWEGLMLRKASSQYIAKRTKDLLKYKLFKEEEFIVTEAIIDDLTFTEGGVTFKEKTLSAISITNVGETKYLVCNVGSGFTREERRKYFSNPREIVGKLVTIKFFEVFTNEQGIQSLRFPVFKGVRDYE